METEENKKKWALQCINLNIYTSFTLGVCERGVLRKCGLGIVRITHAPPPPSGPAPTPASTQRLRCPRRSGL